MKLFVCAVALCLVAVSFCADRKPGQECTKDDKCTLESECKRTDPYCPEMRCHCKESGKVVKNAKCEDAEKPKSKYDGTCAKDDECMTGLKCVVADKKCKCPTASDNYNEDPMKCTAKLLAGGTCTATADCEGSNMECNTDKKCACKIGFKAKNSDDKTCSEIDYAIYDKDCTDKTCDPMLGLECKSKKCVCPDGTTAKTAYYMSMDGESMEVKKCLTTNATVDVGKDEKCMTTYDKDGKYCAKDLKCQVCPGSTDLKCRENPDKGTAGVGQMTFSMSVVLGCVALRKFFM